MASATMSSSSTSNSRTLHFTTGNAVLYARRLRVADGVIVWIGRLIAIAAEAGAARWNQGAQLSLVSLGESFGEQMRKSVGRTLCQTGKHLRIKIPVLCLALTAEDAALA